jgi:hypothetical protein
MGRPSGQLVGGAPLSFGVLAHLDRAAADRIDEEHDALSPSD